MTNYNEYKAELATNWDEYSAYNVKSTTALRSLLPDLTGKSILDIGCGNGSDLVTYRQLGASQLAGMDVSADMLACAAQREVADKLILGDMSQTVSCTETYDVIVSKWALQAVVNYEQVNENLLRFTHPGSVVVILVVHPLRQFLKKVRGKRDYFIQEIVPSSLFDEQVTVYEPTHTVTDILTTEFLRNFSLEAIEEGTEIGCSKVDGDVYPQYLLYKAVRK